MVTRIKMGAPFVVRNDGFAVQMAIKEMFFDRAAVTSAIDPLKIKILRRNAGAIRLRARRSMKRVSAAQKKRSDKKWKEAMAAGQGPFSPAAYRDPSASKPGEPPRIHAKSGDFSPKDILFGYDTSRHVVIVGPVRTNSRHNAVRSLELGGPVPIYMGSRKKRRLVKTVFVRARPFMRPAMDKQIPLMEPQWAGIMRTG